MQFPNWQFPKSVLATALGPLACNSPSLAPLPILTAAFGLICSLKRLLSPNITFYILEVQAWEIEQLGNCPFGSRPWKTASG